jgi:hypothetical protein
MRYFIAAAVAVAVTAATAFAAGRTQQQVHVEPAPTFDECFRLAWVRGVHVERGELDTFNVDCTTNNVPFETGNPSDSVARKPH